MKKDSLYGPPKEVLDVAPSKTKKKPKIEKEDFDEYLDDEEKLKQGYNSS
jgi:hypothetical protein